jgi:hypothetical protein
MHIPETLPKLGTRKEWSKLLHLSVTAIRNAETKGMPAYHPDKRKTIIRREDILTYFTGYGY